MRLTRRSCVFAVLAGLAVALLAPIQALATTNNNESARYMVEMEVPNTARAANGDTVTVTGMGELSVHPKAFTGAGQFTMHNGGTTINGTWSGVELLAFQPYGCGVVRGNPLPSNFCGGFMLARIALTPSSGPTMTGILRVVCIIGDVPGQYFVSKNATEGINLDVPGVDNYNQQVEPSMNIFIRMA